jgi:hypothetical protein
MKKISVLIFSVIMTIYSSISIYANTIERKADIPVTTINDFMSDNEMSSRSGTGYVSGYFTVADSEYITVNSIKMPASIGVKVIKGYFIQDYHSDETNLLFDGEYPKQGLYVNTFGCNLAEDLEWSWNKKRTRFNTVAHVKGDGSLTKTSKLTKEETISLAVTNGVAVSVPGFGEVSSEADVNSAFKGSSSKTVSYTISTGYNSYHDVDVFVTGMGKIDVSVN